MATTDKQVNEGLKLQNLFPALGAEDLSFFQKNSSIIYLKKGQNLFISGDIPSSIYAISDGAFKIVRETQQGESVITRIVKSGDIIGIREIFGEFKYLRTAVSLKESVVFSIDKNIVLDLVEKDSTVAFQFMKLFCFELTKIEKRIEAKIYRPAKNRIAGVLLDLYDFFSPEGQHTFDANLSRREIAELSDVTPETVSRALADFKQRNILKTDGSYVNIIDFSALEREARGR